jgi:hypothetical protein
VGAITARVYPYFWGMRCGWLMIPLTSGHRCGGVQAARRSLFAVEAPSPAAAASICRTASVIGLTRRRARGQVRGPWQVTVGHGRSALRPGAGPMAGHGRSRQECVAARCGAHDRSLPVTAGVRCGQVRVPWQVTAGHGRSALQTPVLRCWR